VNEARGIATLKGRGADADIDALHTASAGWAAGLTLLLAHARASTVPPPEHSQQLVFDYFAAEFFDRLPRHTQTLLIRTALVPHVTVDMAEKLTGRSNAGKLLAALHHQHLFTDRKAEAGTTYQYHALFRDFLLARGRELLTPAERIRLQHHCACLLRAEHRFEDAVALSIDCGDWTSAIELILCQAPSMVAQGRTTTLEGWIRALPPPLLQEVPWLAYWLGVSRLPFNPPEARLLLEETFERSRARGDTTACLLACSAILQSYALEFGEMHPIDRWSEAFLALAGRVDAFPNVEVEVQAISSLAALCFRPATNLKLLAHAERRTVELLSQVRDPRQRIMLANCASWFAVHRGTWRQLQWLIDEVDADMKHAELAPIDLIQWRVVSAVGYWQRGMFDRAFSNIERGLQLAEASGVRVWDVMIHGHGAYVALNAGDLSRAKIHLAGMEGALNSARRGDVGHYHWIKSALALCLGDTTVALACARKSMEISIALGAAFPTAQTHIVLALALWEQGEHALALEEVEGLLSLARVDLDIFKHAGLMLKAYMLLNDGDRQGGMVALRAGLALGKEGGHVIIAPWAHPRVMQSLCATALQAGVEVDYVRQLIKQINIRPPSAEIQTWPWPIKVYVLGRFSVLRNDVPIEFSTKAQRKPLELLKVLIALGGREIDISRIASLVWPNADEVVRGAFDVALMRLRKLLGGDEALLLHEGKLTLNDRYCWVDAWAFERAVGMQGGDGFENRLDALMDLYRGHFLDREALQPWIAPMRDRLAGKFLRAVLSRGSAQEALGHWEAAAHTYRRGLERDNLTEELYRRLMHCEWRLGHHAEAINTYRRCRELLSIVLGLKPGAGTEELYQRIRAD
jgi:LuxR family maltose regulon positive regulatory protein